MKKSIHIILTIVAISVVPVLVFSLVACGKNENNAKTKSLYTQGLEVVQLMSEMTQSEEYIDLYTDNNDIKTVVQSINTGDYTTPKAVYAISMNSDNLAAIVEINALSNISKELKAYLTQRIFGSLMVQINGMSGVEKLATASVCTVTKTFVNENVNENVIYLYTYENAVPAAVTFTVGEDQTISASGVFIMYDNFTCDSAEEVKSFLSFIYTAFGEVLEKSDEEKGSYLNESIIEVTEVLPE